MVFPEDIDNGFDEYEIKVGKAYSMFNSGRK